MVDERELPRDVLADLRAAWRAEEPPASADELGGALEECDPATRRAVGWMRSAWAELEVPTPRVPGGRVLRPRFGRALDVVAGVAAVLLLGLLAYSVAVSEERTLPVPEEPLRGPHVAAVGDNNIELRSGPVTLVLVTTGAVDGLEETAGPGTKDQG